MREPNKAIKRERHRTLTIEDILTDLNGSTVFSKIYLNDGYHQLFLHPEFRYITTFSTHTGLYRYKRLNFGINSAAEIFQHIIRQLLTKNDGLINIRNDILIYGKNQREHDIALNTVLRRLQEHNLTVNRPNASLTQITSNFSVIYSRKMESIRTQTK